LWPPASPRLGPTQSLFLDRDPGVAQGRVDMRSPQLPEVGQAEAIAAALRRLADGVGLDWLDYTSQMKEAPLRQAVCDWLEYRILGPFGAEDVMLTHGGQNAISLILGCCLRGDRPVVLVEDLSYPGFRYAARLARAEVVGSRWTAKAFFPTRWRPPAAATARRFCASRPTPRTRPRRG
jgi:DNA-binding transcriptional MocR family regulator